MMRVTSPPVRNEARMQALLEAFRKGDRAEMEAVCWSVLAFVDWMKGSKKGGGVWASVCVCGHPHPSHTRDARILRA